MEPLRERLRGIQRRLSVYAIRTVTWGERHETDVTHAANETAHVWTEHIPHAAGMFGG